MRNTSHDGGDSTSITSGFENELRKSSVGKIKTKKNSIKRKVQNYSHDSDDTVIEPLLQIDKNETNNRSAKYLPLSKSKTDSMNERESIYSESKFEKSSMPKPSCALGIVTCNSNVTGNLHNHMNTNNFAVHDDSKTFSTVKSTVLVELTDGRFTMNSNQTSSIFTTAKIHADNMTKNMEPIQITPVPILSTVEGNVIKAGKSSDYVQSNTIYPSTSSEIFNLTDYQNILTNTQKVDTSRIQPIGIDKTNASTEHMLKKLNSVLENRTSSITKESESKFSDKQIDSKCKKVHGGNNNEGVNFKDIRRHSEDQLNFQKKNVGNFKAVKNTCIEDSRREEKSVSKQLQRQKISILEDPKEADFTKNYVICTIGDSITNDTVTLSKQSSSSSMLPITKLKEIKVTSATSNRESPTDKRSVTNLDKISKPNSSNASEIAVDSKEITPKLTTQLTKKITLESSPIEFTQTTALLKADLLDKNSDLLCKPEKEISPLGAISSKRQIPKCVAPTEPTYTTHSLKNNAVKENTTLGSHQTSHPTKDSYLNKQTTINQVKVLSSDTRESDAETSSKIKQDAIKSNTDSVTIQSQNSQTSSSLSVKPGDTDTVPTSNISKAKAEEISKIEVSNTKVKSNISSISGKSNSQHISKKN